MADIFISYTSEDRERTRVLVGALERYGWSVWWDRKISVGKSFYQVIEEAIDEARCVVVLWSAHSVSSDWIRNEAEEGKRRGILAPVLLEEVRIPLGFRHLQAANLSAWQPDSPDKEFLGLVESIRQILRLPGAVQAQVVLADPSVPQQIKSELPDTLELSSKALSIQQSVQPKPQTKTDKDGRSLPEAEREGLLPENIRLHSVLEGHTKPVNCVAFSPDGSLIASAAGGVFAGDNTVTACGEESTGLARKGKVKLASVKQESSAKLPMRRFG